MTKKKILKVLTITLTLGLLVILVMGLIYFNVIPARGVTFQGVITAEEIDCTLPDGGESIYVDGVKVTLDPGYITNRGKVGSVDQKLWVCNDFDYKNLKRDRLGFYLENQPNGGEEIIGYKVEVYAKEYSSGGYTLKGNENFYVKVID